MTKAQSRTRGIIVTILLLASIWLPYAGMLLLTGGVSFDLSVTVGGVTVNAYHYQKGSRYNWGIQQWGYDP